MDHERLKGPIMKRSRTQLMSAYAPGAFFTFEGGLAACRTVPMSVSPIDLPAHVERLVRDRIAETVEAWFNRAINARGQDSSRSILPEMCVDRRLLDNSGRSIRQDIGSIIRLVVPKTVGYIPSPLTLICSHCDSIRWFRDVYDLYNNFEELQNIRCGATNKELCCDWQQLDVMFVHWSGGVESAKPVRNQWNREQGVYGRQQSCICGSKEVKLDHSSSSIGDWFFRCSDCGLSKDRWIQQDRDTLMMLGESIFEGGRLAETRMEATSYRASVVHYVQGDRIIIFKDGTLIEKLNHNRLDELKSFVARRLGLETREMDIDSIQEEMKKYPSEVERLDSYIKKMNLIPKMKKIGDEEHILAAEELLKSANDIRKKWVDDGFLNPGVYLPGSIESWLHRRSEIPSRYDPFRLLVEHETMLNETIKVGPGPSGKRPFVPFDDPDEDLKNHDFDTSIRTYFNRLGVSEMGMIRNFEMCFFSFGYSRMSAGPVLPNKHNTTMPVRLKLFDPVTVAESQANPVYTVSQGNEAVYVRLREGLVREWLLGQQCSEHEQLESESLSTVLLSNFYSVSPYLDNLPKQSNHQPPSAYLATYTLLHTYAHHVMHAITEFAGLDAGSLGEYIFPVDLAFVVYRNGMTMDLGNISAMWRNNGYAFFEYLLSPIFLNCGLGTLCTERGGACPNCVMIPEVSCVAQNRLLSRSVLNGHGKPEEDGLNPRIDGYFQIAASYS